MGDTFMLIIGIDPGTKTGFAVLNKQTGSLIVCKTIGITRAMSEVSNHSGRHVIRVFVEDARKRKWFGKDASAKAQGAGSVKRDCAIWEEFLTDQGIPFEMVDPKTQRGLTKMDAERFKALTGWQDRTSEHARDAAILVIGR